MQLRVFSHFLRVLFCSSLSRPYGRIAAEPRTTDQTRGQSIIDNDETSEIMLSPVPGQAGPGMLCASTCRDVDPNGDPFSGGEVMGVRIGHSALQG
uniref:Putative secreted peptide n=1 Tax=Anopheles braziliensis TaxID=58242 RepID=A0A2M3ZXJ3_9DIPT